MDVISFSKAMKAKKAIQALNDRLGTGVQDVYTDVKTRLENLEAKDPHVTLYNRVSEVEENSAVNLNKHNLHVNAILNKSKFDLTELAFDDFADSTGMDATKSTGQAYDATNKLFTVASGQPQASLVTTAETLPSVPMMITVSQAYNVQDTVSIPLDLTKGTLTNVSVVSGKLQLASTGGTTFAKSGSYESPVIDCGTNVKTLLKVTNNLTVPTGTTLKLSTATSADGVTFDPYVALNSDGTIASNSARYIKVKADLTSGYVVNGRMLNDYTAAEASQFQANSYLALDGSAHMKVNYSSAMNLDSSFTDTGTLLRNTIDRSKFKAIEKVSVS